jgi:hypothetical protein
MEAKMRAFLLVGFLVMSLGAVISASAQDPLCSVRVSYWDNAAKAGSSWHRVGDFPMKFGEYEDTIEKDFSHSDSNLRVFVGVERIKSIFKSVPDSLKIAISLSASPEGVFDDVERSEAQTIYDKSWKILSVGKDQLVGDRTYSFQVSCSKRSIPSAGRKRS